MPNKFKGYLIQDLYRAAKPRFWQLLSIFSCSIVLLFLSLAVDINLTARPLRPIPQAQARLNTPIHQTKIAAGNAISPSVGNLDVAIVMDTTGSMEFNTICYGCWDRCDTPGATECPASDIYLPYPNNGRARPFAYPPADKAYAAMAAGEQNMFDIICGGIGLNAGNCSTNPFVIAKLADPVPQEIGAGQWFIILEAEFYSNNSSIWNPAFRAAGTGYWAIQRNRSAKADAVDGYRYLGTGDTLLSGAVRHHPYDEGNPPTAPSGHNYTAQEVADGEAPRLDYNFRKTWTGDTYLHFKVNFFDLLSFVGTPPDRFFWAVDGATATANTAALSGTSGWKVGASREQGAVEDDWEWISVNAGSLSIGDHVLKIWAGSPGFAFDKIIITNQSTVSTVQNNGATAGSAQGLAADPCNPIFGLTVTPSQCTYTTIFAPTNNLDDPLFDDIQSIRGVQEAFKSLITTLDPRLDQVGVVSFAADPIQRSQLECLRGSSARAGTGTPQSAAYPGLPGVDHDELNCFDEDAGTIPISFTLALKSVEDAYPPYNNTGIADGLRRGLHMLGSNTAEAGDIDPSDQGHNNDCTWSWNGNTWLIDGQSQPNTDIKSHCARGQASTPVIVLLTDGYPTNSTPGDNNDCTHWGETNPKPYENFPITDDKYECIMYYADFAAANGVLICTIGMGIFLDAELLQAVAARTNGQFYFAPSVVQLETVVEAVRSQCIGGRGADLTISQSYGLTDSLKRLITYTMVISNIGPVTPVTATVTTNWTPREIVTGIDAPDCLPDLANGRVTCTVANLAVGAARTFPLTFTTVYSYYGYLTVHTTITETTGLTDAHLANNSRSIAVGINGLSFAPIIMKEQSGN